MAYALLIGSKANAQDQADFEAAVENVGGAGVCIGGVAIDGNVCVQAVNIGPASPEFDSHRSWWQRLFTRSKKKV